MVDPSKVELGDLNAVERVQVLEGGAHSIPRKASSGGGVSMDTYVLLHAEERAVAQDR